MKIEYGFIADLFSSDYQGGAELTTHALMESHPKDTSVWAARCEGINSEDFDRLAAESKAKGIETRLIFGNFVQLKPDVLPNVIVNFKYYIVEYDYKFCEFRSIEKHLAAVGSECDCHESQRGKLIEQFYSKSEHVFFMSEEQRNIYRERFPSWDMQNTTVLSSVFTKAEWRTIEDARTLQNGVTRKWWTYQNSSSWIKGSDDALDFCEEQAGGYGSVGFKDFDKMSLLNLFSESLGFVFFPRGGDTCPRVVIEAKLMDCHLELNENVQMRNETWFKDGTYDSIKEYLQGRPTVFWEQVGS